MTGRDGGPHVSAVKAADTSEHRLQFTRGSLFVAPAHWHTGWQPNRFGEDMTTSTDVSDLDNRIVQEVDRHWNEHAIPLLLSQLGNKDGGDIARETREEAGGLAAYLRSRLAHRVRIVQHSSKPVVIGAIPADVDQGTVTDFDALLSRTLTGPSKATPRFRPAFRAAFQKTLEETKRRYISMRAPLRFVDATPDERPDDVIEVQREYILDREAEIANVVQQAQAWLNKNANDVDPALYLSEERWATPRFPVDDLLSRLLLALDAEELKRISMPLDIVSKLRRQSL